MLVAVEDLQDYMDVKFSPRQTRAVEGVLAGLEGEMEAVLRRPLSVEEFYEKIVVDPNAEGFRQSSFMFYNTTLETTGVPMQFVTPPVTVYLRNAPVASISEIKVTPAYPGASAIVQTPGIHYTERKWGVDLYRAWANDVVEITYTAGLPERPHAFLKSLILRAASREVQNMHDDVVGIKDLNTRNVAPLVTGFTEEEIKSMRRYRRVRI